MTSGSIIQLISNNGGLENLYIYGAPEKTLFKGIYKRITLFAKEPIKQTFNGTIDFNNRISSTISKSGDLISNMLLEITLPKLACKYPNKDARYINNVANYIINEIELVIGDIVIVKHYGRWLHIWNELTQTNSHYDSYNYISGVNREDLNTENNIIYPNGKLYVPLKFWFCNNLASAFPLIACSYHEMKLNVSFNSLESITTGTEVYTTSSLGIELFVDYIFLDESERYLFATKNHEYIIEQLQFMEVSDIYNISETGFSTDISLTGFNHPVKEIIWAVQQTSNELSTYSNVIETAGLYINKSEKVSIRNAEYFNWLQSYFHHTNSPVDGIYCYSFALYPELMQSSGTCNFSQIDSAQLKFKFNTNESIKLYIFMVNYNVIRIMKGISGLCFIN
jgi:hypothetical protein